jgi:hypothetical protein
VSVNDARIDHELIEHNETSLVSSATRLPTTNLGTGVVTDEAPRVLKQSIVVFDVEDE